MRTKWDDMQDSFVVFQGARRLWPRLKAGLAVIFLGRIVTGVPWSALAADIEAMKKIPSAAGNGLVASLADIKKQ